MGNRMLELLGSHELKVYLLNTGRVGGTDEGESKKVTIPYSSAIVQAIVSGTIEWVTDPDFGYEVASSLPGVDDIEILQPRQLYQRQGRLRGIRRNGRQAQAGAPGVPDLVRRARRRHRPGADPLTAGVVLVAALRACAPVRATGTRFPAAAGVAVSASAKLTFSYGLATLR